MQEDPFFFLLMVLAYSISKHILYNGIKEFFDGIALFNLLLFLCTILPIRYPKWWIFYAGRTSDGYSIIKALKG